MMGRKSQDGIYKPASRKVWYCRFTDANGKKARLSTGEQDEKKAQIKCLQMMQQAISGELSLESENIKVHQVLELYFSGHGNKLKGKGYLYAKGNLLKFFKNKKWRDLCANKGKLVKAYINKRADKDNIKPATINKELGLLSAAANYVNENEDGLEIKNPVPGKKQSVKPYQYTWLTVKQAEKLIDRAKTIEQAPYLADFIIISLGTGMRLSEVLQLKVSDIDIDKGYIYLRTSKTEQPHELPMSEEVKKAVQDRIKKRSNKRSPFIFCHKDGSRIKSVRRGFKTACKKANIPVTDRKNGIQGFRIHDQRHTVASWLVSDGTPLIFVQDLLNHSSIKTTERYAHLAPENRIKTVQSLPKLSK